MKYILSLLLLIFTSHHLSAQNDYPHIKRVDLKDKVFHGKIGEDPISLYLRFQQYTPWHNEAYLVAGWYLSEDTKEQIPLAGLYDRGELVVYHFSDNAKSKELLTLKERVDSPNEIKHYKGLADFDEKLTLTRGTGTWENQDSSAGVVLQDNDLAIKKTQEYLVFDDKHAFDLRSLGLWHWNYQVKAQHENKLILEYEHPSKRYGTGRCAAGTERGFVVVEFDNDNSYIGSQSFILESCLLSIEVQNEKQLKDDVMEYHCENFLNSDAYVLTVDYNRAEITKKEK